MSTNRACDENAEIVTLAKQMQSYFDSLALAGLSEPMIVSAALCAASERVAIATTPTQTAAWLRGHAFLIEKHGVELVNLHSAS